MKTQLLKKTLFTFLFLIPIVAFGQETKKLNFSLGVNYRTVNAKANSLLFKDLNGNGEAVELMFGISYGERLNTRLEVGVNFTEFSANTVGIFGESIVNNSLKIRYLQIPIVMKSIFNFSEKNESSSLIQPYIAYGINVSKHLDTRMKSLLYNEKMSSEGWDAYFRGGFGLIFNLNKNLEASLGFEGVGPIRKRSSLNDKRKPTIEGVYLQMGITYKF